MNNNTSKNKKKNDFSDSSNLNLGILSFSTSNISANNVIKSSNIFEEQNIQSKENLNIFLDEISNYNKEKDNERHSNLITNGEQNKIDNNNNDSNNNNKYNNNKNNRNNVQTKSAEQSTRNPKYFKNDSIYNSNIIYNCIDSNETKNGKLITNNKLENNNINKNNQINVKGQKDKNKKNVNNNAYKELTDITKNNLNEILSKKNIQKNSYDMKKKEEIKNNDTDFVGSSFIKKYLNINDGKKYKNPEELHFSMVKISQNINLIKGKF
jgi:hypothetical protein